MSATEVAYRKAFIKFVNVELPKLLETLDKHTKALNTAEPTMLMLARVIRNMPTSMRLRY